MRLIPAMMHKIFSQGGIAEIENVSVSSLIKAALDAPKKQTILRLRWLIIAVGAYLLLFAQEMLLPATLVHVFILLHVCTNAGLYALDAKFFDSVRFLAVLVFADTVALSVALIAAGQLGTDFYLCYFLIIIMAGFWRNFRWSLAFAVILSGFYSAILFLTENLTTQLILRVPFILCASVFYSYFVQVVSNEQALRQKAEKEARHDVLTGLPNRQAYNERISHEIDRSRRYKRDLAVLMVDIDNFKLVNDSLGHDWGDIVLQKVAAQLTNSLRSVDFVARLGGEEFVIILPETDIDGAINVANRARSAIRENPVETEKGLLVITVSIGVSGGMIKDLSDEKKMLRDADQALYHAKRTGKDRVEAFQQLEQMEHPSGNGISH